MIQLLSFLKGGGLMQSFFSFEKQLIYMTQEGTVLSINFYGQRRAGEVLMSLVVFLH